jgi:uncharacterized LabA/DUF88 family protein
MSVIESTKKSEKKKSVVYAFIDSQNLNLGIQAQGWKLDFKKFRLYLKNKYGVEKAIMFLGSIVDNDALYDSLKRAGFEIVFKPVTYYNEDGKVRIKGNVDAELVLYAAHVEYENYDKAIIVSGDGDFYCLIDCLIQEDKLLRVLTPTPVFSHLLKSFSRYITTISTFRSSLRFSGHEKDRDYRSVETLGLPGRGDTSLSIAKPKGNVKRKEK